MEQYIKKTDKFLEGECDGNYKQIFYYKKALNIDEAATASLYENNIIDDEDLKIINFVYKALITDEEQVLEFCKLEGIEDAAKRLEKCFINVLLNRFALCTKESRYNKTKQIPKEKDAKYFYCLTSGGRILLDKYVYYPENEVKWNTGSPCMSSMNVRRMIISTEHYLKMRSLGNLQIYRPLPTMVMRNEIIRVNNVCKLKYEGEPPVYKDIITEVVLYGTEESDLTDRFKTLGSFFRTNGWQKYFFNKDMIKPSILIITEDDSAVSDITKLVLKELPSDCVFYVSTIERMKKGYDKNGSLLQYDELTNSMKETSF
jgi:hypothetical protein